MTAKRTGMAAVLAAGVMMLGGCDQAGEVLKDMELNELSEIFGAEQWEPQEPEAISIDEDGRITEIIQEELDAAYYSATELYEMITAEVQSYNKENKGSEEDAVDPIAVKAYVAEGESVRLEMVYESAADYAQFNNVEFYYGSMIGAQLEGYLFDVSFKKVRDGVVTDRAATGTDVIREMDDNVLVVRAPLEVKVPGTVIYTSANAEVKAADVVWATGAQENEQEEEALVLPSSAVYRPQEEEPTFAQLMAANRVYIVFEEE